MNQQEPFAIEASLTYSGAWGDRSIRYWYRTRAYWRAESDGTLILLSNDHYEVKHDEGPFPLSLLTRPGFLLQHLGVRFARPGGQAVTMLGRQATRCELDPHGTMTTDDGTGFVLDLHTGDAGTERHLVTGTFTVLDTMAPEVFDEESLNTSPEGYYSGHLP